MTHDDVMTRETEAFTKNMIKLTEQYQKIWGELLAKQIEEGLPINFDPFNLSGAISEAITRLWSNPEKLVNYQCDLVKNYLSLLNYTSVKLMGEQDAPLFAPNPKDKRFKSEGWTENIVFDHMKQSYLMISEWLLNIVQSVEGLDPKEAQKLRFHTKQFIDAASPSNFAFTNPEVLQKTIETHGANLVKGMENLFSDLQKSHSIFSINTTNKEAFTVGKDIATTPGNVVYQNELMQLIHYAPRTQKQFTKPLLCIPAWINKYYILDLKPENSFVRWALEQGHDVFIISWVNPTKQHAQKNFEDYMLEGPLAALDAIQNITGQEQVNAVGYCLGGTLLTATLAYMQAKNDKRIASATLLTTLIDFADAGDLSLFVDEVQLEHMEQAMEKTGYYDGSQMAATFNMLRANDMIWSFVVNNYLLGQDPFPFDLLYWNADSTRLPAKMHSFYLRNMYQQNLLAKPGKITLNKQPIDIRSIEIPLYILSTRDDHIAPWKATFATTKLVPKHSTFVLAGAGHVAGVINPPAKNKYGYWVNNSSKQDTSPELWLEQAEEHQGSWWQHWQQWITPLAGSKHPVTNDTFQAIEDAPGSYVMN